MIKTLKDEREPGKFYFRTLADTHVSTLLPNVCCIASRAQTLSPYHGCKSLEVRDCAVLNLEVRETGTRSVFFASLHCISYGGQCPSKC